MAKTPSLKLDVSPIRAVGALHVALGQLIDDHPDCPEWVMDFEDQLKEFETKVHLTRYSPCYFEKRVKFHQVDFQ